MPSAARTLRLGALAALLLTAAWLFWPATLGGGTTYVTTHGVSMQPRFHTGDLAILRDAGSYTVGDVVAYHSETLHTVVMHRIVARDGARFVTKGDHNTWLDPDHPAPDEVLGKLWLRVPHGGATLAALKSPRNLAVLALCGTALSGASLLLSRRRRLSRGRPARRSAGPAVRARARRAAVGFGALAVVAVLAGTALLVLPTARSQTHTVPVLQQGRFDYSGSAQPGATYPTGRIATGDPIYTHLITRLDVAYTETLRAPGLTGVDGTARLDVALATADGWHADLAGGPVTTVRGDRVAASVVLDTAAAADLLNRHFSEVGVTAGQATLTITPRLAVTGAVQGHRFTAGSMPGLTFTLDPTALRLGPGASAALAPATQTAVPVGMVAGRTITLGPVTVPVGTARDVVVGVLALALLGLAVAALLGRSRSDDPVGALELRCAGRLLPVSRFTPGEVVVDLTDGEALARVAERLDALVLHAEGPEGHVFAVRDQGTTYRFAVPTGEPPVLAVVPAGSRRSA
jgi:signal peptidase I